MSSKGWIGSYYLIVNACVCWLSLSAAHAQAIPQHKAEVDFAAGFSTTRQTSVQGTPFWQQGGFAELSMDEWRGLGAALLVIGQYAPNANGSGIDTNAITVVFDPRYTLRHNRFAVFAEGLIGESNAFGGIYPSASGAQSNASSFAANSNGGVEVTMPKHFSLRLIQAGWQYTQFPSATTNRQKTLMLGTGIVFRLQH